MYNFSYFKEKDKQAILDFIEEYPFAFMTGSFASGRQVATQIPFLLEERDGELYFQGHIMRNTDHHKAFIENPNCLLVFTGPSCYVSASWYSNPQIGSTWNYMSVHIQGQVKFMTNEELVSFMKKLTSKSFKTNGSRMKIAIVISFFYEEIATELLENVKKTLLKNGVLLKNIKIIEVPGALEMPLATKLVAGGVDAVITLGAVIKGSTAHFDYVCGESYRGLMDVSLEYSLPVILAF